MVTSYSAKIVVKISQANNLRILWIFDLVNQRSNSRSTILKTFQDVNFDIQARTSLQCFERNILAEIVPGMFSITSLDFGW